MPHAIRIHQTGAPDVMQWEAIEVPPPAAGEVQIRLTAVGLNYIDVYFRSGLYPQPLPGGIGMEGAGRIEAVGDGVTGLKVGDRVAFGSGPTGAYADVRNMPAAHVVPLPDSIDDETGAAMMLKGLTVQYLFRRTFRLEAGQTILFHAAAGGVGLIAMQWAKALGVTVIGTVGSPAKAELARAHGCDHIIYYREEDVASRVREITGGAMVPVVYDAVGKDTFQGSLDSLAPFGTLVSFGNASGPVPPVPLTALRGSLYVTRPSLVAHVARREVLLEMAQELFAVVAAGQVRFRIDQRYPLAQAARAHTELEARRTTGQSILLP